MGSACAARMWPKPMLADDGCVLGFDQAVVAGLQGPAFGLLDQELVEQLRDRGVDPAVNLLTTLALKTKTLAGFDKPANRLQTQLLRFVHADLHLLQTTPTNLQAHLVLESIPAFRLILCWT
jgi:hypothetical protein